jgi:hypothetical protein
MEGDLVKGTGLGCLESEELHEFNIRCTVVLELQYAESHFQGMRDLCQRDSTVLCRTIFIQRAGDLAALFGLSIGTNVVD